MDTVLLVQPDPETRRAWFAALRGLGVRVMFADRLADAPRLAQRERIAAVVAAVIGDDAIGELRWVAAASELPPLVIVTDTELLPPLAARSRGAAMVPRGRPETLVGAVAELLSARRQPAMNLPLRLPQVFETKWTARLRLGRRAELLDTWPGDAAA